MLTSVLRRTGCTQPRIGWECRLEAPSLWVCKPFRHVFQCLCYCCWYLDTSSNSKPHKTFFGLRTMPKAEFSFSCCNSRCTRMLADLPQPGKGETPSCCLCICLLSPRAVAGALKKFMVLPAQSKMTSKDLPLIYPFLSASFDSVLASQTLKCIWLIPEHHLLPHW